MEILGEDGKPLAGTGRSLALWQPWWRRLTWDSEKRGSYVGRHKDISANPEFTACPNHRAQKPETWVIEEPLSPVSHVEGKVWRANWSSTENTRNCTLAFSFSISDMISRYLFWAKCNPCSLRTLIRVYPWIKGEGKPTQCWAGKKLVLGIIRLSDLFPCKEIKLYLSVEHNSVLTQFLFRQNFWSNLVNS